MLTPDKKSELKLIDGVKAHNAKYHTNKKATASLYFVLTGPNSGKYAWINGPMNYSDMDWWPGIAHQEDWQINVRNYITDETIQYVQLNWNASHTPPNWGSPDKLLIRTFKVKNKTDSRQKLMQAITKIKEALVKMDAPNPRRVYFNVFRSENGEDISLVYPFKSYKRFKNSNGLPPNFFTEYDKINGDGSFKTDVGDVIQMYSDGWYDEVRVLVK